MKGEPSCSSPQPQTGQEEGLGNRTSHSEEESGLEYTEEAGSHLSWRQVWVRGTTWRRGNGLCNGPPLGCRLEQVVLVLMGDLGQINKPVCLIVSSLGKEI